jgi:hypothetical protein
MASLGRPWRAFWRLSWAERGLLCRAWVLLPMTAAAIRVMGFRWTQAFLGSADQDSSGRHNLTEARVVARIVHGTANHHLFHASCLVRSLVLGRLLRSRDLLATLRIGVTKPDDALAAHAWIEHGGIALAEADTTLRTYAPFDELSLNKGT